MKAAAYFAGLRLAALATLHARCLSLSLFFFRPSRGYTAVIAAQAIDPYSHRQPKTKMASITKKTVLITGCTTGGIGWAMAKVFHARGYYVFATVRGGQASKAEGLAELGDVEMLNVDVTDTDSIARARDVVAKRTGGRLDVLVNNAGAEFVRPLLDTDIAEAKKLFDVNVWGPLAMVQAFAPLLIAAKGIVSNHTSIASVLPLVWAGTFFFLFLFSFFSLSP